MISIKKVLSENDREEYFLFSSIQDGGADFEIALLSVLNFKSYNGMLTNDYLKTRSIKMRMLYDIYLSETKSALTYTNPEHLKFEYNVTEIESDSVLFEWKKHVEEEELTVVLGSLKLSSILTADLVILLFSNLSKELQHMYYRIEHLGADQNRLRAEREDLLNMLKEANEWKSSLEAEMYAKFALVLNSKKEKIRDLMDQLEQCKDVNVKKRATDRTIHNHKSVDVNCSSKTKAANDSLDIFSDEELNIPCSSRTGRYISSNQPSKKKMKLETKAKNEELSSKTSLLGQDHALDAGSDDLFDEL